MDLLPYFKVFPAETLADERFGGWTMEERGAWFSLLLHAWVNGSIPSDLDSIGRILHLDATAMRPLWAGISDRFIAHPDLIGRLTSRRLEMEREDAIAKSEAGTKAAKSRWGKKNLPDATVMRPHSDRNAEAMRPPMPTAQRSAAQRNTENTLVAEAAASSDADGFGRVAEVWNRVCVPVGFAKCRATPGQRKAARTRLRESGWLDAFVAACSYMAREPFYRGASSSGWVATLGWLLKPGNAEKTAERAGTRKANGREDPEVVAALADAEADLQAPAANGEPAALAVTGGEARPRGREEGDPPSDLMAEDAASLRSALGPLLGARRPTRQL